MIENRNFIKWQKKIFEFLWRIMGRERGVGVENNGSVKVIFKQYLKKVFYSLLPKQPLLSRFVSYSENCKIKN